jgi:hypothetical protein
MARSVQSRFGIELDASYRDLRPMEPESDAAGDHSDQPA